MEASGKVATDVQDQLRLSAELWTLVVGTTFPIHELDPKYGTLVNPLVDLKGENPASGGYAEGSRIITTPHTGGNQLDGQQGGTSYTNPEHQLNPGVMYSESELKNVYDSIRQAPKFPAGFKDAIGGTTKNAVKNQDVLSELRKVEAGTWQKIYKDGYDASGNKVSVHYFQSKSGKVFDVKVKNGWSN